MVCGVVLALGVWGVGLWQQCVVCGVALPVGACSGVWYGTPIRCVMCGGIYCRVRQVWWYLL